MKHELKIYPVFYRAVKSGSKTFEVRTNDRLFLEGDEVALLEWDPTTVEMATALPVEDQFYSVPIGYTGNAMYFKIGFVLPIDDNRVAFSLLPFAIYSGDL